MVRERPQYMHTEPTDRPLLQGLIEVGRRGDQWIKSLTVIAKVDRQLSAGQGKNDFNLA
jgi:hypothetical protein